MSEPENAASGRIPYTEPTEPLEFEHTTAGRVACEACGEWIYPRRRVESDGPLALPSECPLCGVEVSS